MRDVFVMVCGARQSSVDDSESLQALCASGLLTREPALNAASCQTLARSLLLDKALDSGAEVFLSIDTGIKFTLDDAQTVVDAAKRSRGIAGAFVPHPRMIYNLHLAGRHTTPFKDALKQTIDVGPKSRQEPVDVDAVCTGFMAIHRSVPGAILRQFPHLMTPDSETLAAWFQRVLFPRNDGGSTWLSLDHSFCWYAKRSGVPVQAVPSVAVGHRQPWWGDGDEPANGVKLVTFAQAGLR